MSIAKEIGDRAGESICYINLGTAYFSLSDPQKAVEYYEKVMPLEKEMGKWQNESLLW